jgi:hypothetical protein
MPFLPCGDFKLTNNLQIKKFTVGAIFLGRGLNSIIFAFDFGHIAHSQSVFLRGWAFGDGNCELVGAWRTIYRRGVSILQS